MRLGARRWQAHHTDQRRYVCMYVCKCLCVFTRHTGNALGRVVLVVDDLVQTGGTLIECAKVRWLHFCIVLYFPPNYAVAFYLSPQNVKLLVSYHTIPYRLYFTPWAGMVFTRHTGIASGRCRVMLRLHYTRRLPWWKVWQWCFSSSSHNACIVGASFRMASLRSSSTLIHAPSLPRSGHCAIVESMHDSKARAHTISCLCVCIKHPAC